MEKSIIAKLRNILVLSVSLGVAGAPTYALSSKVPSDTKEEKKEEKKEAKKESSPIQAPFDISKGFSQLAEKAIPTVVNVSTTQIVEGRDKNIPQFAPGSPLDEIFKDFFDQQTEKPRRVQSLGSGFIVKSDGKDDSFAYVVTNFHVISDAKKITVILHDSTELEATLHAADERTDIALLKVKTDSLPADKRKLAAVEWGDSHDVKVGDWVMAIGNPFGLGSTVTNGIISNRSRNIGLRGGNNNRPHLSEYVDDFMQHNASINMGNSGGPLFNLEGKVIGVNSAIFSPSGGNVGIGFAIPSNLVEETISQLIKHGRTIRGWLGVKIQTVTAEMAESFGLKNERGAVVSSVVPKGPAAEAGIEPKDIILEFDGKEINDQNRLSRIVGETEVGKTVKVKLLRNDKDGKHKEVIVDVKLGEYETASDNTPVEGKEKKQAIMIETKEILGIKFSAITATLSRDFHLKDDTRGAVVVGVSGDSPAATFLKPGDVVSEVNMVEVKTPEEVIKAVEDAKINKRKNITFLVNRGGDNVYATFKIEDDLKSGDKSDKVEEAKPSEEAKESEEVKPSEEAKPEKKEKKEKKDGKK